MPDVGRDASAAGDLEAEHVLVERGARFLVAALERAVRERLRNIPLAGELGFAELALPVRPRDGAAFRGGLRIVVLDLERVAARLLEVDRAREVLLAGT